MSREVHYSTICADIYTLVSETSGIPTHMLTLSNGVQVLRRKNQLYNYMLPSNPSCGLNLHCSVKRLGGGSRDELGEHSTFGCYVIIHYNYLLVCTISPILHS